MVELEKEVVVERLNDKDMERSWSVCVERKMERMSKYLTEN